MRKNFISVELYDKIRKSIPILCVDVVAVNDKGILLIKRKILPSIGYWCLPGGRILYRERVNKAVLRHLKQETGLKGKIKNFVGIYDDPKRDSMKHAVSLGFLVTDLKGKVKTGPEGSEVKFFENLPPRIGFDHKKIISDAMKLR